MTFRLDEGQLRVAAAEPEDRQIVIAGPGAGKTHAVTALLDGLVSDHGVHPEEIVVVSFSRAAVHAARSRATDHLEEGGLVDFRTLDSWAARILLEHADADIPTRGFDGRVREALALVDDGAQALEHVRHIVVDEVQDVVGLRARFLLRLLERAVDDQVGFTLLGDPLQGLYDFQLDAKETMTSSALLERVRGLGAVSEIRLTGSYRARGTHSQRVPALHGELTGSALEERYQVLLDVVSDTVAVHDIDELGRVIESWTDSTTVVLADTNSRAAVVRDALRSVGIRASLQGAADRPSLRAELGLLFEATPTRRLTREDVERETPELSEADRHRLWLAMRETVGTVGATVEGRRLASVLAAGATRPEFLQEPASKILVSTVHRAKGLEFDNVVLVDPLQWERGVEDREATTRSWFVALSRGRDAVCSVNGPEIRRWFRDPRSGRSYRGGPRPWQTFGTVLGGEDTRGLGPTPLPLADMVGRAVRWSPANDDGDVPVWDAMIDDQIVARTSTSFGEDLARRLRPRRDPEGRRRWPGLSGGVVEDVETVVGPAPSSPGAPMPRVWLSAQVTGLLTFEWGTE